LKRGDGAPGVLYWLIVPTRTTRQVGYVTTSELAGSAGVRALVRELRATVSQRAGRTEQVS
jgi:hypothetical protein